MQGKLIYARCLLTYASVYLIEFDTHIKKDLTAGISAFFVGKLLMHLLLMFLYLKRLLIAVERIKISKWRE